MPINSLKFEASESFADKMDAADSLKTFRDKFHIPKQSNGEDAIYFTGNSLGLQPKSVRRLYRAGIKDWETLGVEGHFKAKNPWMPYHERLTEQMAKLIGAKPIETVVMNSLTGQSASADGFVLPPDFREI
jgi:kynureninase